MGGFSLKGLVPRGVPLDEETQIQLSKTEGPCLLLIQTFPKTAETYCYSLVLFRILMILSYERMNKTQLGV